MKSDGLHFSTTTVCALLLGLFQLGIWLLPPPPAPMEGVPAPACDRLPLLHLDTTGWRVDVDGLNKSVLRSPSTALLRKASNGLKLTFGEFPDWLLFHHHRVASLFLALEARWTTGLTPTNRVSVERAATTIGDLNRHFRAENWKMVVLPVPTKMSIYRENVDWPLRQLDPLTVQTIREDHTDEVCDLLFARLAQEGVVSVDLRQPFRQVVTANDGRCVFPPGESHWSGLGVSIAAERVADALASLGAQKTASSAPWVPYKLSEDMGSLLDHFAGWPPALRGLSIFTERVERGNKPSPGPKDLCALVAVSGTSYTGQYSWLGDAGLAASLDCRLPNALVKSYAEAGRGSLRTVQSFIEQKTALLEEMAATNGAEHQFTYDQKYFVWEFPVRDLQAFLDAPHWIPSVDTPLVRSENVTKIVFAQGFYQQELTQGTTFRWSQRKAALHVSVDEPGRYRLSFKPITAFSTSENVIAVSVNESFAGALSTHSSDFKSVVSQFVDAKLVAGENLVTFESNRDEIVFGAGDPRSVAFGIVLPITVAAAP